jgi:nickel/cobalt exporter
VTASPALAPAAPDRSSRLRRLAVAVLAVLLVAGLAYALASLFAPEAAPAPKRNPFGAGPREAAPASSGLAAWLIAAQAEFSQRLRLGVAGLKAGGSAWPLILLGLAYGVFHAAGPGHGKAVVAAYLVSSERALRKGVLLSFAAAFVQAVVAVAIVGVLAVALQATARTMDLVAARIELLSFALVALVGAALVWRKAGKLVATAAFLRAPGMAPAADATCDHVHLPPPEALDRLSWRDQVGVVLAAGIRPCTGALVVLVFALTQGVFLAGVGATFAMALGTAVTTSLVALLAVYAKGWALKIAGGRGTGGALATAGLELLAAAFVFVLGVSLVAGVWGGASGN